VRACVTLNIGLAGEGAGISNGTPASGAGEPSTAAARLPSKSAKKNKKKKVTLHIVRYHSPQHLPALSKTSPVLCIGSFMRLPAACFRHVAQQRTGNVHQIGRLFEDRLICAQAKKEFVPLPTVEALVACDSVPWSIGFTQRLGRHVMATRDIAAGKAACLQHALRYEQTHASVA